MKSEVECSKCFCDSLFHQLGKLDVSGEEKIEISKEVMRMICEADFTQPPPLIAARVNEIISAHGDGFEPFKREKELSTKYAHELLENIRPELEKLSDPFEAYVLLAIAGNIIDFGVDCNFDLNSAREKIIHSLSEPFDRNAMNLLRKKMEEAENILYIMDNCGEAVFDTLLVSLHQEKITLAVRGKPILNDITRAEVEPSGFQNIRVIDTGDFTPGISLTASSKQFMDAYRSADLIIAKGQGNFETLCDDSDRPVFFLFRAKCPVVIRKLGGVKQGSYQLRHINVEA